MKMWLPVILVYIFLISPVFGQDTDADGVPDYVDNCIEIPNGPYLGTCVKMVGGVVASMTKSCENDGECGAGETCDLAQGDMNANGKGDACDCYADCDCSREVNLADLVMMKGEFLRYDCAMKPCCSDCNGDNQLNLGDLVIMKTEFLRNDCLACTDEEQCSATVPTTSTTTLVTTTTTITQCGIEIARGSTCPLSEAIDDPAYNRPGRRGLAATCNDVIDFTVCSDCMPFEPTCLVWTIEPPGLFLHIAQIGDSCWRLAIDDSCEQLEKIATYTISVIDTCNNVTDSVEIDIGKVIVDIGETNVQPDMGSATVDINLINPNHAVSAFTLAVAACDGGEDHLACNLCEVDPGRAFGFTCSASEQPDGSCMIVMYAVGPSDIIEPGSGTVAQLVYSTGSGFGTDCGENSCTDLCPMNIQMVDQFNEELCVCASPGEACFKTCGDVYPQDCFPGCCGDGVIDLFDVMEMDDIIEGLQTPTQCQLRSGDVPNGVPPYCGNPPGSTNCESDGDVDIDDRKVIYDKALGIMNCCDYCLFGKIY